MNMLREAGYIEVKKLSNGSYPLTIYELTEKEIDACEKYLDSINEYFSRFKNSL